MKTIDVGKMCKISESGNNNSEYVLDVIALEETDYGFINFQFGASIDQNCCESNALDSIDYNHFDEVEERISNRWGIDYKEQINVTKKVVDYIEFETSDDCEEEDEDCYNTGGWIKISIVLDDGQRLTAEYSNYHNGYYAHGVSVSEDGDVIYEGIY